MAWANVDGEEAGDTSEDMDTQPSPQFAATPASFIPASSSVDEVATSSELEGAIQDLKSLQREGFAVAWPQGHCLPNRWLRTKTAGNGSGRRAKAARAPGPASCEERPPEQPALPVCGDRFFAPPHPGCEPKLAQLVALEDLLDLQAAGIRVTWPRSLASCPR